MHEHNNLLSCSILTREPYYILFIITTGSPVLAHLNITNAPGHCPLSAYLDCKIHLPGYHDSYLDTMQTMILDLRRRERPAYSRP